MGTLMLRIEDFDTKESWTTPLDAFLIDNHDAEEVCDIARAVALDGIERVIGGGAAPAWILSRVEGGAS